MRRAPAVDDGDPLYVKSSVGDDGDLSFGRQEGRPFFYGDFIDAYCAISGARLLLQIFVFMFMFIYFMLV